MKKLLFLTLLLLSASFIHAKNSKSNHEFNITGMLSNANKEAYRASINVNYTYCHNISGNFKIGAGTGFEWISIDDGLIGMGHDSHHSFTAIPVFADLRYDLPLSKDKLYLVGVADTGILCAMGSNKTFESPWFISPQLGVQIKLSNKLDLNIRAVYRYIEKINSNSFGLNIGISF